MKKLFLLLSVTLNVAVISAQPQSETIFSTESVTAR